MKLSNHIVTLLILLIIPSGCRKPELKDPGPMPVRWEYDTGREIYYASPALSFDETTIYTGTSGGLLATPGMGNRFIAIDAATGVKKWSIDLLNEEVRSAPAVAPDNTIWFTTESRNLPENYKSQDRLYQVSPEGALIRKILISNGNPTSQVGLSAPAIGSDGTIYVAGDKLYAFNPDGSVKWTAFSDAAETLRNSPVIGEDGTVYFVFHNIPLTALDPDDGSVIWSRHLGVNDYCLASPAIGSDGTIYVIAQPGIAFAVSATGDILWTFDLASIGFTGVPRSSPAVDSDGCIYFGICSGSPSSALFCLNPNGTLKWKFEPSDLPEDVPSYHFDIYSSPALGTGNIIYFGQEFGRVYALSTTDGSLLAMREVNSAVIWSSPVIDNNGILYINGLTGTVYGIESLSSGPDPLSPWPRFRHDNQGTGRK